MCMGKNFPISPWTRIACGYAAGGLAVTAEEPSAGGRRTDGRPAAAQSEKMTPRGLLLLAGHAASTAQAAAGASTPPSIAKLNNGVLMPQVSNTCSASRRPSARLLSLRGVISLTSPLHP